MDKAEPKSPAAVASTQLKSVIDDSVKRGGKSPADVSKKGKAPTVNPVTPVPPTTPPLDVSKRGGGKPPASPMPSPPVDAGAAKTPGTPGTPDASGRRRSVKRKNKKKKKHKRGYDGYDIGPPDFEEKRCWFNAREYKPHGEKCGGEFIKRYQDLGAEGIKAEFKQEIEDYKSPKFEHREFDANPTKNRIKDLIVLDDSLVTLSDKKYINASWMYDLQHHSHKFILAQVPVLESLEEFWQMVYEQKAIIVLLMARNKEEQVKAPKGFWVDKENDFRNYGNMIVKCTDEGDDIVDRMGPRLQLSKKGSTRDKDHSVILVRNDTVSEALHTIAKMEGADGCFYGPIVLMDKDGGIGAAAVYAVTDVMGTLLSRGKENLSLPAVVKWARKCRNGAIQTEEDYAKIVRAVTQHMGPTIQWMRAQRKREAEELK